MIFSVFSIGTFATDPPAEPAALTLVSATVNNTDLAGAKLAVGSKIELVFSGDVTDPTVLTDNKAKIKVVNTTGAAVETNILSGTANTTIYVVLGNSLAKGAYTLQILQGVKSADGAVLANPVYKNFDITVSDPTSISEQQNYLKDHSRMSSSDMTFVFYIDRGTYFQPQQVFDTTISDFVAKTPEQMKSIDPYVMFPTQKGFQEPGATIQLPFVTAPKGWTFTGWYCVEDATPYAAGYGFMIPDHYKNQKDASGNALPTAGGIYTFKAMYNPAEAEEDTFAKVFEILAKIFGTIIGLIAYEGDTAAGIAFVRKIFDGITG